ncbi:hypothetical protein C2845_PM06G26790 [Panicum miliaceum]|uniref:Aminotransferase-like plant mobile domain-containing protein n=1 Tax=Panicum miliaceum TaxID=4540 RepID=A0A3L6RD51_PANMI|nr:hypothetical protein C2845_PM06G26790 [Panicum miliaceum]
MEKGGILKQGAYAMIWMSPKMKLLNDSLDQQHRAYAHVMEGNDSDPVLCAWAPIKLGQFNRSGFLGCSHGDTVDAPWIPDAQAIADSELDEIPKLSWGSAVLCWTYRGLCQACIRKKPNSNLTGMPLMVNLWSYERFQVGRPYIQPEQYTTKLYGGGHGSIN